MTHYQNYVDLLHQLHQLNSTGLGDSDEADALRDKMDEPYKSLNEAEILQVRELSAELYSQIKKD